MRSRRQLEYESKVIAEAKNVVRNTKLFNASENLLNVFMRESDGFETNKMRKALSELEDAVKYYKN